MLSFKEHFGADFDSSDFANGPDVSDSHELLCLNVANTMTGDEALEASMPELVPVEESDDEMDDRNDGELDDFDYSELPELEPVEDSHDEMHTVQSDHSRVFRFTFISYPSNVV
ncbi:hypothetical protein C8R45DRAFT_1112714 [Mycena sanguinolenta]|nr:hypothetical protein C8R45DRAFT_1112714 [Mycena sanguinolenta]